MNVDPNSGPKFLPRVENSGIGDRGGGPGGYGGYGGSRQTGSGQLADRGHNSDDLAAAAAMVSMNSNGRWVTKFESDATFSTFFRFFSFKNSSYSLLINLNVLAPFSCCGYTQPK